MSGRGLKESGAYALLWANGMKWADLVTLIANDAFEELQLTEEEMHVSAVEGSADRSGS